MIKFLKSIFSKGEKNMTNVSNLKNLKQNVDKTQKAFEDELKRINNLLPNGVTIEWEGVVGETETLVDINNKSELSVGDTIRCIAGHYNCLTEGRDYQVVRMDSSGDAQIIDDDGDEFDTLGGTNGNFKKVTKARKSSPDHWISLTRDSRAKLQVGDIVRRVGDTHSNRVVLNKEYTIVDKPDRDGRFFDESGYIRDTIAWTVSEYDSASSCMEFRHP